MRAFRFQLILVSKNVKYLLLFIVVVFYFLFTEHRLHIVPSSRSL